MAKLKTIPIHLNSIQISILKAIPEIIEARAREPSNHKTINVNAHILKDITGHSYQAIKTNLYKFKELQCC